jgi:glutathione S-transferase
MSDVKLLYFNLKGLAEISRVIMKIGGINFEDARYPFAATESGFSKPEFDAKKAAGEHDSNMGRVPILFVDGAQIGQSKPIERFLARRCNLMGSTDVEAAQIECIAEHTRDIKDAYSKIRWMGGMGPSPEKEAAMKKWYETELAEWLVKLEKSLPAGAEGCAVGSAISYADICIWHLLRENFDNLEGVQSSLKGCHRLEGIANAVATHPSVVAWVAERPQTVF